MKPTLSIELLKPHTHAGKRLTVGALVNLNDASARWLIAQGVAKAAPTPAPPAGRPAGPAAPLTRRDATPGVSTTATTTATTQGN